MESRTTINPIEVSSEIRENISKILNVPANVFDVMDKSGDIYIVHHEKNCKQYNFLRGVIVDLSIGKAISLSNTNSGNGLYETVTDHLGDDEKSIALHLNGQLHKFTDYKLFPGYEGLTLRVFKIRGTVYFATYKTLFALNKKWGNSKTFQNMWKELKCPNPEDIFGEEETSSICYHFLLVHKDFQIGSRFTRLNPGFVVLTEKEKLCYDQVDGEEKKIPTIKALPGAAVNYPKTFEVPSFSLEEANNYLKYGLHKRAEASDPRLANGESVILKCMKTGISMRITSVGMDYRKSFRTTSSIEESFFIFITYMKRNKLNERKDFIKQMVPVNFSMQNLPVIFLEDSGDKAHWPLNADDVINYGGRAFLHSLPPTLQTVHKGLIRKYFVMRREVASWLIEIADSEKCDEYMEKDRRIHDIITQSRRYQSSKKGNVSEGNSRENALGSSITYLTYNEFGSSLVRLHKLMEQNKKEFQMNEASFPELEKGKEPVIKHILTKPKEERSSHVKVIREQD